MQYDKRLAVPVGSAAEWPAERGSAGPGNRQASREGPILMRWPLQTTTRWLCGVVVLAAAASAEGRVIGRIVHAGYPASMGHVVREGAWFPVVVDLSLDGQAAFDGYLRVGQPDKDGDIACDRVPVQLRADPGAPRRYVLYAVAPPRTAGELSITVDVLDSEGTVVELFSEAAGELARTLKPPQPPLYVPHVDGYVILELSGRGAGRITALVSPDQYDKYDRPIVLAHIQPEDLPDRWLGLEMVDCVVWEAADATELSLAQVDALVHWVRQGGVLMVAAARTADTLAKSEALDPILPVRVGPVVAAAKLPVLRRRLLNVPWSEEDQNWESFEERLPVLRCETRPGAETVVREEQLDATVVARWGVGRGRVVFVGAELRDLFRGRGTSPVEFFKRSLHLRRPRYRPEDYPEPGELFGPLENVVGFRRSTGLYLLGAVLFSIVYVGVATFGSWAFLRGRGWTRQAWSVFGVVAAVGSVLSLLAVGGMRGVGRTLHQLSVVDAWVGRPEATASVYLGLKTGTYSRLDLWLPADYTHEQEPQATGCFLKPMPSGATALAPSGSYADPIRYRLVPASGEVHDVPVRATLKQFEGRWAGRLRRTVEAEVRVREWADRSDDLVDTDEEPVVARGVGPGSTITNHLDQALTSCFILHPLRNVFVGPVDQTPRSPQIRVFPIGDIGAGEQIDLAERMYATRGSRSGGRVPVKTWSRWTLGESIRNWGAEVRGVLAGGSDVAPNVDLALHEAALMLLSVLGEHNPVDVQGKFGRGYDYRRRHCRQLDRSDELTTDVVMLVGFTAEQGPVTLCTRAGGGGAYKPLLADRAYTMYRFLIPVEGP